MGADYAVFGLLTCIVVRVLIAVYLTPDCLIREYLLFKAHYLPPERRRRDRLSTRTSVA
jgi:hypothetical protein